MTDVCENCGASNWSIEDASYTDALGLVKLAPVIVCNECFHTQAPQEPNLLLLAIRHGTVAQVRWALDFERRTR